VAFHDTATTQPAHEVIVPKSSVRNQDGKDVVFVVQDSRAERRAVTVASAQDDDARLSAGVSAGERVVVDSPTGLADGAAVKEQQAIP